MVAILELVQGFAGNDVRALLAYPPNRQVGNALFLHQFAFLPLQIAPCDDHDVLVAHRRAGITNGFQLFPKLFGFVGQWLLRVFAVFSRTNGFRALSSIVRSKSSVAMMFPDIHEQETKSCQRQATIATRGIS